MSTPLFIRSPYNGSGIAAILGASLAAYSGATAMDNLTDFEDEPLLIEDLAVCVQKFSTQAGQLLLALVDGYGDRRLVGAYAIAAGTASLMSSDRIRLDLVIEVGFKLVAAHDVKDGGSAYTSLHVVPIGGIVR